MCWKCFFFIHWLYHQPMPNDQRSTIIYDFVFHLFFIYRCIQCSIHSTCEYTLHENDPNYGYFSIEHLDIIQMSANRLLSCVPSVCRRFTTCFRLEMRARALSLENCSLATSTGWNDYMYGMWQTAKLTNNLIQKWVREKLKHAHCSNDISFRSTLLSFHVTL